jgi:hypothetical protein
MMFEQPTFPTVGTLASRALARLLRGRTITHRDFWFECGTYRLAGYVHELREAGWPVITVEREKETSDRKRRVAKVGEYHLTGDVIAAAGGTGHRFVESVERWETWVAAQAVGAARATELVDVSTQTSQQSISKGGANELVD